MVIANSAKPCSARRIAVSLPAEAWQSSWLHEALTTLHHRGYPEKPPEKTSHPSPSLLPLKPRKTSKATATTVPGTLKRHTPAKPGTHHHPGRGHTTSIIPPNGIDPKVVGIHPKVPGTLTLHPKAHHRCLIPRTAPKPQEKTSHLSSPFKPTKTPKPRKSAQPTAILCSHGARHLETPHASQTGDTPPSRSGTHHKHHSPQRN